MSGLSKFEELRHKTDRELLKLLNDDVDFGLAAAARRDYAEAKRAHDEVSRLLPLVYEMTDEQRIAMQVRLRRLCRMIDSLDEAELCMCGAGL